MALAKSQVVDGSFTSAVQQAVARRTGFRCSNPRCRKSTIGPHAFRQDSYEYVGECAHICAQAAKGERYDQDQLMEERGGLANAIHLCCTCHALVDHKGAAENGYSAALLREWKQQAEAQAENALLRGENTERAIGELLAEVKLLKLQVAHLQQTVCKLEAADTGAYDDASDTSQT